MKRVSFNVAKAIKEAGYPQELKEGTAFYTENGLMDTYNSELYELFDPMYCVCPYVMQVWLWLWREKKTYFGIESESYPHTGTCLNDYEDIPYLDPEEAIIAAIEYLVENNLIK